MKIQKQTFTGGNWYVERIHKMKCKTPIDSDIWAVKSTQKSRYVDAPQDICSFDWLTPAGKANAHLISAAPNLLEALKKVATLIYNTEGDQWQEAYETIEAAIAKAEGMAQ